MNSVILQPCRITEPTDNFMKPFYCENYFQNDFIQIYTHKHGHQMINAIDLKGAQKRNLMKKTEKITSKPSYFAL